MDYDLLIKHGRVVDGSGLPSYIADVGIKDGRIVDIGRLNGSARRTIDADGLVVSPGFIDHHTHMDGQILWDPFGTCEPQHGVTSIIMGNCGLALAPVKSGDEDAIVKSFVRVEAIPRIALEKGVPGDGKATAITSTGSKATSGSTSAASSAISPCASTSWAKSRRSARRRTAKCRRCARRWVRRCARARSVFRPTETNDTCVKMACRCRAAWRMMTELFALCEVVSESNSGVIQMNMGRHCVEQIPQYDELARRTRRPIVWQSVQYKESEPELWKNMLKRHCQDLPRRLPGLRADPHGAADAPFHHEGRADLRRVSGLEKSDVSCPRKRASRRSPIRRAGKRCATT